MSDRNHACERLAALDVAAAAGDLDSAREARWHEQHPAGARTPEEAVQEAALGRSA